MGQCSNPETRSEKNMATKITGTVFVNDITTNSNAECIAIANTFLHIINEEFDDVSIRMDTRTSGYNNKPVTIDDDIMNVSDVETLWQRAMDATTSEQITAIQARLDAGESEDSCIDFYA